MVSLHRVDSHPLWLAKPLLAFCVELCSPIIAPSLATPRSRLAGTLMSGVEGSTDRDPIQDAREGGRGVAPEVTRRRVAGVGSSLEDMDIKRAMPYAGESTLSQ